MTVSQWRVAARKRWMWRRPTPAVRRSPREGPVRAAVVATVVVVVPAVRPGLASLCLEAAAAAAAVVRPRKASSRQQARLERRNTFTSQYRQQVGGRWGGKIAQGEHRSARL